jgi:sirohydrochlorin ferrochelatase
VKHAVLLHHGSADPRSAKAADELAASVAELVPETTLHVAALSHAQTVAQACDDAREAGATEIVVVPLFLTPAFHARVDVPAAVDEARKRTGLEITVTEALGTDQALLDALAAQLPDGPVVLAVAGTSDETAQIALQDAADIWAHRRGKQVAVGHLTMGSPTLADSLSAHADASVAAYVLLPGALPDRIVAAATGRPVSGPLYALPETARRIADLLNSA